MPAIGSSRARFDLSWRCPFYVEPMPRWGELLVWASVVGFITAGYLALRNPYWSVGSDGDFFLAVARNIAQGQGLWHNGNPVGTTPPGWPLLLAAGMKLTPEIATLKLINIAALLVFFAAGWWVLRRYFSPWTTAAATLMIAFSPTATMMTWSFLSDPTFAALVALAIWAAVRVHESASVVDSRGEHSAGVRGTANLALGIFWAISCVVLVMASVAIRWPGILIVPLIGAVLLRGDRWWRPRMDRRWMTFTAAALATFAMFFTLRYALPPGPEVAIDHRFPDTMVGKYALVNTDRVDGLNDVFRCFSNGGRYISEALWFPVARTKWAADGLGRVGWVLVGCAVLAALLAARRRQWLLAGAIAYCLPIVLTWPTAVPRYLLPVLPMLIAGALVGLPLAVRWFAELVMRIGSGQQAGAERPEDLAMRRRWAAQGFAAAVVTGLVLVTAVSQASAYYFDHYIMRSGEAFAKTHEAGVHRRLPSIALALVERDVQPGEVAISERKAIRLWSIRTHGWMRALYALLDRPVRAVPIELSLPLEESPQTLAWLQSEGVRYYAWLPPSRSTLAHFRTGRLETFLVDDQFPFPISERQLRETDWWLYEISDQFEKGYKRMKLTPMPPPTQVPHLQ